MSREEAVIANLVSQFGFLEGKVSSKRPRRIFAEAPYDKFTQVFEYTVDELQFSILCAITGLDEAATFAAIYHLARTDGTILNLKVSIPKEKAVLKSVSERFPAADIYEREIADLLGVKIEGLKPGKRYPLPDDWPEGQHPLRKDWKGEPKKG
jgi:Ni,Fe-hydrogenase III component G